VFTPATRGLGEALPALRAARLVAPALGLRAPLAALAARPALLAPVGLGEPAAVSLMQAGAQYQRHSARGGWRSWRRRTRCQRKHCNSIRSRHTNRPKSRGQRIHPLDQCSTGAVLERVLAREWAAAREWAEALESAAGLV